MSERWTVRDRLLYPPRLLLWATVTGAMHVMAAIGDARQWSKDRKRVRA